MTVEVVSLDASFDGVLCALEASSGGHWGSSEIAAERALGWSEIWGVLDEGVLKAYAAVWWIEHECHILNVLTHHQERKKGYARMLLAHVLTHAKTRGCGKALLEVAASNTAAQGLYASLGFAQVGVRKNYYRNGLEDALLWDVVL